MSHSAKPLSFLLSGHHLVCCIVVEMAVEYDYVGYFGVIPQLSTVTLLLEKHVSEVPQIAKMKVTTVLSAHKHMVFLE